MREYEIQGIEPFNDIFYKTCMYNPLISGVNYAGGSVIPFLSNDFFSYLYNENGGFKLRANNIQKIPDIEILKEMGINIENILNSNNFIEEIKALIDKNIPVLVPIDRYYWTDAIYNFTMYNKVHFSHFFLVYGYNDSDSTFKLIDVADNFGCFKNVINYNELIECYNSFCSLKDSFKMFKVYQEPCYSNNSDYSDINKYAQIYIDNFYNKKSEIIDGLKNIKKAIDYYESCHTDISLILKEDKQSIAKPFGLIERAKKVQIYQIYRFFGYKTQVIEQLKAMINNYNIIKGLLIKTIVTKTYNEKSINSVVNRLNQNYQLELSYYENLESIFNDWRGK